MSEYKNFESITGYSFKILSTVDHPFVSVPVRLLDSHRILYEKYKNEASVLNWDVSQPNERVYRYDLQIDLAIIGRSKDYFFFREGKPYASQDSLSINFNDYEKLFNKILSAMIRDGTITQPTSEKILNNYKSLKEYVFDEIVENNGKLVEHYTQKSLVGINRLLERDNIANFIQEKYIYYFGSSLMTKWIPYCIDIVNDKKSILQLLSSGVFNRKIFRSLDEKFSDDQINSIDFVKYYKSDILELIRNSKIIPSIEILYWSLEIAGICHFGNDYRFYKKYSEYLNTPLTNQMTSMYSDGKNYFEIDRDYGMTYNSQTNTIIKKNDHSEVKHSRINSAYAIYLILGESMKRISLSDHKYSTIISINDI